MHARRCWVLLNEWFFLWTRKELAGNQIYSPRCFLERSNSVGGLGFFQHVNLPPRGARAACHRLVVSSSWREWSKNSQDIAVGRFALPLTESSRLRTKMSLQITVVSAANLPNVVRFTKSDPKAVLKFQGEHLLLLPSTMIPEPLFALYNAGCVKTTKVKRDDLDPEWNKVTLAYTSRRCMRGWARNATRSGVRTIDFGEPILLNHFRISLA